MRFIKALACLVFLAQFSNFTFAQQEKVFNYSDTVFLENSIRHMPFVYNFGSVNVIKDSTGLAELEAFSEFIKKHPNMYFHIECYTDSRGSAKYNQRLSQGRIESVYYELYKNYGVDTSRVKAIGYGEYNLILPDKYLEQMNLMKETECFRETLHAVNRRTLLRIVEIK